MIDTEHSFLKEENPLLAALARPTRNLPGDVPGSVAMFHERLVGKEGPDFAMAVAEALAELQDQYTRLAETLDEMKLMGDLPVLIRSIALQEIAPELPNVADIYAHDLLDPADGFYPIERDDQGVTFRWTGPQPYCSFIVSVDRGTPLLVTLHAIAVVDEARQKDVLLLADGVALPLPLGWDGHLLVGQVVLPPARTPDRTRITLCLPCVLCPTTDGSDPRMLGLAFRRLSIRPAAFAASPPPDQPAHQPAPLAALLTGSATLGADEVKSDDPGFYGLEIDRNQRSFRWSGRDRSFTLHLAIDRAQPVEIVLRLIAVVDLARQSPLSLEVDGEVASCAIGWGAELLEARAILPARVGLGITRLTFTVPVVLRPSGDDDRMLGVAFHTLEAWPADIAEPAPPPPKPARTRRRRRSAPRQAATVPVR